MGSERVTTIGDIPSILDEDTRPVILLTGFGPFADYKTNPAWLALQALEKQCNDGLPTSKVKFIYRMIPVEYETVSETMPRWWNELRPKVIIHVGTGLPGGIHVEKRAYNKGYCCRDVESQVPCDNCYAEDGPAYLETELNVEEIVEAINSNLQQTDGLRPAKISLNPGRFLCGFIYYQSLLRYSRRCIFIHVPPTDDSCVTAEKLAHGLKQVVLDVIKQSGITKDASV